MKKSFSPCKLLLPLVPAYRLGLLLREVGLRTELEPVRRLRFPVVSIGSLSAGGAGKTPLTITLAKSLTRLGMHVDVLSRGYRRQSQNPARVAPDGAAVEFGDEPLLIARETGMPVYVAARRYDAGLLAEAEAPISEKPTIHLLDDGFQHRQLHRDVNILLLDGHDWHDGLLPSGNLREPLQAARRANVIAIPADNSELEAVLRAWGWQGPVWRLHRRMEVPKLSGPVVAFCGIAHPKQFFAGLEATGLHIAAKFAFPDHHRYSSADLKRPISAACGVGATALITTEKDQVRLGKLSITFPESLPLKTAALRIEIEDESTAIAWLIDQLKPVPAL